MRPRAVSTKAGDLGGLRHVRFFHPHALVLFQMMGLYEHMPLSGCFRLASLQCPQQTRVDATTPSYVSRIVGIET